MRRGPAALAFTALAPVALVLMALTLSACGPHLPKGVDPDKLDQAISNGIGDPQTCVLIGRQGSGQVVWRYNTHTTCARTLPACDHPGARTVDDLLKATARDGQARALSCNSSADGSRGVGWASGVIQGRGLVWAAVMEGNRALPGRIMAEQVKDALQDTGLSAPVHRPPPRPPAP